MDSIQPSCEALYLVGDIFDFCYEYKYAIPKGFTRILGKIASFTDAGIPVHVFTGNHDMWIFDYLPKELGVQLYRSPVIHLLQGKRMFIGHGDGLGPGDYNYKRLKKIFESPIAQFFFGILRYQKYFQPSCLGRTRQNSMPLGLDFSHLSAQQPQLPE
jgi:UDP-2,3-diacylglucosamine hydrolase